MKNKASSLGGGIYSVETPALDYNDVWNNTGGDYYNIIPGAHDISADPLLVDPANGNFHLAPGSPCIDAGDPDILAETDFEGDPRPMGLAPDIGADETKNLHVGITGTPGEALPGAPVTYFLQFSNQLPIALTNLVLTDTLSGKTSFTNYQADGPDLHAYGCRLGWAVKLYADG